MPQKRPKRTVKPAAKAPAKRKAKAAAPRRVPLLRASDLRIILHDLSSSVAPGDVEDLLERENKLRATAASIKDPQLALLRTQLDFALDCLRDHLEGECPQIPYTTISLLTAGVCYFADEVGVIPDFLPGIGKLDDAAVMAMAFEMAEDGIRRYCTWKDRPAEQLFHMRRKQRTSR